MSVTLPHELLEGYLGATDSQVGVHTNSGLTWKECLNRLPAGDRFCIGLRGQSQMNCGAGVLHRESGLLGNMETILNSMERHPIKLILVPFPEGDIAETPISIWAPRWIYTAEETSVDSHPAELGATLVHDFDLSEWKRRVAIVQQSVEKAVLSRTSQFELNLSPIEVAEQMFSIEPNGYRVLIETGMDQGLISVSPERLLRIHGNQIETEAIAGTQILADADELLGSPKNRIEHEYVRDWIRLNLEKLGLKPTLAATELQRLSQVAHLKTSILADQTNVGIGALVQALFPTPAVAGVPQSDAIRLINELENSRGLYSGLLGFVTPEFSEFIVLIRYCEWQGRYGSVRSGAGIVHDSDSESEWAELNQKLKIFGEAR